MTKSRQFWALFKFLAAINPMVWIMPLAIGAPLFIYKAISAFDVQMLYSLISVQNLFFVGFLGVWVLVPEMGQGSRGTSAAGSEFLLTRAVDRPVLYRARAALFYVTLFLIPLVSLAYSFREPELKITLFAKSAVQKCLVSIPGSTRIPNPSGSRLSLISIPQGNVLVDSWHLWMFAVTALGVQVLLALVHPLKHRTFIFFTVFLICIFSLPFEELKLMRADGASRMVLFFFSFAAHQAAFWIVTAFVLILGQLWCEHRFCRLDHSV
jgi:hypothetical protein